VIRALLLDLDDTLFDRNAAFCAWADHQTWTQRGRRIDPEELRILVELDARGHRSRHDFASDAHAEIGLVVDPVTFPVQLSEHVMIEPGVEATIGRIAQVMRVGVVTNGGPAQRTKLARIGLDDLVHAVFISGELGTAKPDPEIFHRALRWTEQRAEDVLFVGDHPEIDLAPAAALGMATAWRRRGTWPETMQPPTHTIESITRLVELVELRVPARDHIQVEARA
jgi:putative hydrolase of the HAD superfamily